MQKHLQKLLLIVAMMVVPWVTQAQSAPLSEYTVTTDVTTFNSIASTGTALSFSTQDDGYATTTLPFAFPYGTTVYNAGTSIVCSANGFIQLGASSPSSGTSATYSSSSYCYINAILQQDGHMGRNTGAGAYTRYDATAGTFTIEYHLLGAYSSPYGAYSYQVVLHTNGTIEIIYDSVNLGGASSRTLATYITNGPNNDRLFLTGSWTSPTLSSSYGSRPISPLPTHGLRYTFSTPNFACPRPTSLTASDVTAYGFSINWTDTSSATSWLVQLSSGDSVIYDTVATSQTFTFAGLNPDSYYTAHVSGLCLNGDTSVYRSVEVHTLCVPIDSLPYTYGFEDLSSTGSGTDINPCWSRGYWSGSYNPNSYPYASTTNHTGSRSLYFYSYGTTTFSWVCLPRFADSISNLHLTFWAKKSSASYSGQIKVGVMSNPADYTTFQNVTTVFTDYTTNWQMFDVAMHNAPNTGLITIMVEAGSTSYNYIYLDDITVDLIPYCTTPIVDSAVATATSADLYLSDVDNATSLTLTLSHGTWDTTIYAMGSPISLSDLQPRTEYTYELYATCGSDSSLVRRGSFCTFCSPISHDELPYTNGFEDITATGSGTPLAPCWGRGYWNGAYSSMSYPYASTTNHTGSRSLYFYSYNSSSYEYRSWLCLPEFADSINTLQISFWAKKSSSDYSGQIKVGVMTDPTDYTTFETVTTLHTDATTNWNNFDVILSTAPGSGYITFMIEAGGTTYNYIYLDDITVGEVPQCPHVQNLALDSVYVDWAAISWTEMGTASTWVLEYDTVDFTPGTYTAAFNETVYDTAYIINNLDTGRTYYLYLRADCSGDTSTYMSLTFSTLNGVPATVPYLCTFESNGTNGWDFANGTQTNHWMVGTTGGNGALFITNDDINNSYTISATSNVYAYRDFYLTDTGEYVYSFDWKGYGESCCDYLRAALMPASFEPVAGSTSGWTQATGTPISGAVVDLTHNNRLNLSNNWGNVTGTFNLTTPGAYKWVFFWHNDGSVGTTPPAAVDNVQLAHNSCPSPTNVTASYVAADTVTITWSPGGNENHWVVGYGSTQEDVYDTTYTFTGLSASTDYVFIVSAVCDADDTSMAATLAVRTACGNITLPFFENFDNVTGATTTSVSTNNLPQCWNNYNVGTNSSYSGYPIVYNSSSYAHSGTNAMRFYIYYTTGSYADQYTILPPTDSTVYPINSMMLNFWMRANSTSYNSYVIVGVMPDENDASSFIPYQYVYTNNSTVYAFHEVDFSDYTGVHGRIAMKFPQPSSGYNYGYVDDIRIELVPDCPRVTNITASNITNSSADIYWTENGEATSWSIEYGVHGFEVGTGTSESVSSLPHTLTGLTANTEYDIYVTPDCSGTPAVANITFRTECDAMTTLPYVFGFEGTNTTSSTSHEFVNCWHRLNNGTQYFGYPYITSTAHTGSRSLYWYTSTTTGTYGDYQIVVLPAVDETLYPINTLMLKFWARSSSTSYYPTFQVGVMTDPNDANTFQQVASIDVGNSTQWAEYTAGLANYNGTGRYVALRALRGGWYAYTDDFTLEEAPTCPQVTNVEAVSIGTTGAMLNWSLQSGFAGLPYEYEIEVIPDNPSETFSTLTSSTTHFLLTGLQPSSSYSVRVRGNCGDGYGAWSTLCEFTTLTLPCYQVDTTIHDSITFAGSMTNTNYYIPLNNFYDYSITEQLIMASEMGGSNRVSGIDFYYSYSSPSTLKTNCTIYMANTTVSSLASSFVPYNASTFTRVYTGSLNCSQGWNHFEFSTPFNYDGSSNIVILVHDNSGDYDGSTYTFRASQVGSGIARYSYQDGDPFSLSDLTSGGSSYDYRTDMRLHVAGCALSDSCGAPLVVVDSIAPDQVDIVWAAGFQESSWRVEYRQGSQAWDVVDTVSTPAYSFTGLTPATTYQFRITALCNDTSRATIISATTPCLPMAVPFFENFETFSTSTADPLPACWYKNTNYSSSYPYASTSYNHSAGGNKSMYMYSSNTSWTYMVLPTFDLPLDSTMLSFWLYKSNTSYAHNLTVGVMTDPTDVTTFTEVAQAIPLVYGEWEPFEFDFTSYNGNGRYIAIMSPNGAYSYPYLDDLSVDRLSPCPRVRNITASAITGNSATISWAATSASDYEVEYGPLGFTHGNGTTVYVSAANSTSITGLHASSAYDVYVRGFCDSDTSNWSFAYTFRTECGLIDSLPYFEDFETVATGSSTNSSFVPCWTRLNNGSTYFGYPYVSNSTTYNHTPEGSRGLYWSGSTTTGTYGDYQYIVFPAIDTTLIDMNTVRFKFWARSSSTSYNPVFHVGVMTNPNNINTFQSFDTINIGGNTSWACYTTDFDTFAGNGSHIALRALRPTSSWYAYVDDIGIYRIPDCEGVSDIQITSISTNSADFTWTENGAASSWEVEYGPADFVRGSSAGTITTVSTLPFSITGLTPNTEYDLYITPECSEGGYAETVRYTFRTECIGIDSLPFFEDFESASTGSSNLSIFLPCWHRLNNGSMYFGYPYVSSSSTYNHTYGGGKGLYWYNSTTSGTYGDYQYVVLPAIDTLTYPMNTLQLSFWAKSSSTSYNPIFEVGILSNPYNVTDSGSFESLGTINVGNSTEWDEYTVGLNAHIGGGNYVAIRALRTTGSWYAYVDDIKLELLPNCPRVEDLTASNITINSAMLTWSDTSSTNTSWYVEYDTVNFIPGSGTVSPIAVADTFYAMTGLDSGTVYHVYVYPDCGTTIAERYLAVTTLAASPASVPYFCDFEQSGLNGWDLFNGTQTNAWCIGSDASYGGNQSLYISNNGVNNTYSTSSTSNVFAIRNIHISDTGEYVYSYTWRNNGESCCDYIRVALMPETFIVTPNQANGFGSGSSIPAGAIVLDNGDRLNVVNDWNNEVGMFTLSDTGTYKLVFFWHNDGSVGTQPPAAIDNVSLVRNTCPFVNNLSVGLFADSISMSWTPGGTETEWLVTYDTFSVVTTSPNYTITGLTANSDYMVAVRAICGYGDTSVALYNSYHTPCAMVSLPYSENFDGLPTGTGNYVPCWQYIMTGTGSYTTGSYLPKVYSSSTYAHSGSNVLYLYGVGYFSLPPVAAPLDSVQLTFWDYTSSTYYGLEVGVMEGNTFVPVQTITTPTSTHLQHTVYFGSYTGNSRIIAFRNYYTSSSTTYYSYHYLDDVTVDYIPTCPPVFDIVAAGASTSTIDLDWSDLATASAWQIEYGPAGYTFGSAAGTRLVVTSHPTTISGLDTLTAYDFYVRPICSATDTGDWPAMSTRLTTAMCDNSDIFSIGSASSTSTSYYAPVNNFYNYTLSEVIIDSTELDGPRDVQFIGYYYDYATPSTDKTNCTIYFQPTNRTVFSSSSDVVALDTATAVRVYTGSLNCSQGWNFFALDTIYHYDGTGNLMVIVDDNSGAYDGSAYVFKTQSCTGNKTLYYYSDSYNPDVTTISSSYSGTKSVATWRPVMQLVSCLGAGCRQPVITGITHTYESATITWTGDGTDYEVNVKESAATDWPATDIHVTGNTYTFTGLQPATNYTFRVRQDCTADSLDYSAWVVDGFVTDSLPCLAPDSLHVIAVTNADATFDWSPIGNETAWELHVWYSGNVDSLYTVYTHPATVGGFTPGITYQASVRPLCGSAQNIIGEWGDTITFTTATCPNVSGLTASVNENSITLNWTADPLAVSWEIEYGFQGFDQGTGTTVTSSTNTYTINGLMDDMPYDFHVRAICGTNWYSEAYTTVTATTGSASITCNTPTAVTATVAGNSATVSWTAGAGNISFELEYGTRGFARGSGTSVTATASPATLTNLAYETDYDVYVRAYCGESTYSDWSPVVSFTTEPQGSEDCDPVTALSASNVTESSALITWTPGNTGDEWEVVLTNAGGTTLSEASTTEHQYQFSSLTPGTSYVAKVRTVCGDGQYSDFVSTSFTTQSVGINEVEGATCAIFPNPTSGSTTITVNGVNGKVKIAVVDMNGREVASETLDCSGDCAKTMDVDRLAQGAYFVRITAENVSMVRKLIVR